MSSLLVNTCVPLTQRFLLFLTQFLKVLFKLRHGLQDRVLRLTTLDLCSTFEVEICYLRVNDLFGVTQVRMVSLPKPP